MGVAIMGFPLVMERISDLLGSAVGKLIDFGLIGAWALFLFLSLLSALSGGRGGQHD
jgi:hypothetical protein